MAFSQFSPDRMKRQKFVDYLEQQEKQTDIQIVMNNYIEVQLEEESQEHLDIIQKQQQKIQCQQNEIDQLTHLKEKCYSAISVLEQENLELSNNCTKLDNELSEFKRQFKLFKQQQQIEHNLRVYESKYERKESNEKIEELQKHLEQMKNQDEMEIMSKHQERDIISIAMKQQEKSLNILKDNLDNSISEKLTLKDKINTLQNQLIKSDKEQKSLQKKCQLLILLFSCLRQHSNLEMISLEALVKQVLDFLDNKITRINFNELIVKTIFMTGKENEQILRESGQSTKGIKGMYLGKPFDMAQLIDIIQQQSTQINEIQSTLKEKNSEHKKYSMDDLLQLICNKMNENIDMFDEYVLEFFCPTGEKHFQVRRCLFNSNRKTATGHHNKKQNDPWKNYEKEKNLVQI